MDAKLPGFVTPIRRDIVRGEYLGALAELARATPCDRCELRQRCAAEQLACRAFVSYVHRSRDSWRKIARCEPTRALYAVAMGEGDPVKPDTRSVPVRLSAEERARAWIGRRVGSREVVGIERARAGGMRLLLHCDQCGRVGGAKLSRVSGGRVPACRCELGAARKKAGEARREQVRASRAAQREQTRAECDANRAARREQARTERAARREQTAVKRADERARERARKKANRAAQREQARTEREAERAREKAEREQARTERAARPKPWEIRRDERAARLAVAAAQDARFMDPEMWKPCEP